MPAQPNPNPEEGKRPSEYHDPNHTKPSHAGAWAGLVGAVIVILIVVVVGLYLYRLWRSRRLGLPPPSINPFKRQNRVPTRNYPAKGGVVGWIEDRISGLRKGGSRGAYESGRGGFGPLDGDEAWDARVGHEGEDYGYGGAGAAPRGGRDGFYEEQELGLRGAGGGPRESEDVGPYGGGGYSRVSHGYGASTGSAGAEAAAGHRGVDEGFEGETHGLAPGSAKNPFADDAERSSLAERGPSPARPTLETGELRSGGSKDESPTERRSVFKENV